VPQRSHGPPQIPPFRCVATSPVTGRWPATPPIPPSNWRFWRGRTSCWRGWVGYNLALPPRHEKLTDFRVLVINMHPLCPTADGIKSALNGLGDSSREARLPNFSARAPELPDLARTTRAHVELLLAAVYSLEHTGPQIAFQRIVGMEPQLHGDVLHDFGRPGRQPKLRQHPPACVHRRHDRGIQVRS